MARELTTAELKVMCYDAWRISLDLPHGNSDAYQLLLRGGFRWIEIFELDRWSYDDHGTYYIQTAKGGNLRSWREVDIPLFYLTCLQSEMITFPYVRYSTFNRTLRRTFVDYPIWHGDKNVTSHIFRYTRVKDLYESGQNIKQIADYLGEVDLDNIQGYIDARLIVE